MRTLFMPRVPVVLSLAVSVGCGPGGEDYSPSLTQIRIGEVEVVDPPEIPEDRYVPGIVTTPEDYEYSEEAKAIPFLLDTTYLEQLEDPKALEEHKDLPYTSAPGSLFDENKEMALEYDDVRQGAIGDCYWAAAISSALFTDSDKIMRNGLIREVRNREDQTTRFAVRFYDAWGRPQDVAVDADLVRRNGRPAYARSADSAAGAEEWAVGLVEKAYAQWHGGFEKIGNGGYAGDVLQALTGSSAAYRNVKRMTPASIVTAVKTSIDAKKPVVACTYGEDDGVDYNGTGVYAYHCYSVLGASGTGADAKIALRNPWGSSEPAGNGPDDGIFDMNMADFMRLYEQLSLSSGYTRDTTAPGAVNSLALAQVGDGTLAVTWKSTGDDGKNGLAVGYDVRISNQMITAQNFYQATAVAAADPASPGTVERLEITGLTNGSRYYVAIKVLDEAGNASAVSNVINEVPAAPAPEGGTSVSFDFEDGEEDFEATGLWHITDLESVSGSYAFWFGDEDSLSYSTGNRAQGSITSPILYLPAGTPKLSWQQYLDVEAGSGFDMATVEIATQSEGYSNWTAVWSKADVSPSWLPVEVGLDGYAGQRVKVRFAFDSVDGQGNDGIGWLVDDIRVY
jgi:hypothetical protein